MMAKLWDGLGGKLGERWLALLLSPSLVFWCVGLWLIQRPLDWAAMDKAIIAMPAPQQVALVAGALLLVSTSAALARRLRFALLRILEGYWPRWLGPLRRFALQRARKRSGMRETRFQTLAAKGLEDLTDSELDEYQRLDESLMCLPADARYLMPTRLGRVLRAAELASWERYRLDGVVCWPRLWLLLPESVRDELSRAREALDAAVELWLWGLLTLIWTPWSWWVAAPALALLLYAYRAALRHAQVYASLIVAAYDLYRGELYRALRWPLPGSPAQERAQGEAVTRYLWRGSDADTPAFTHPADD